MRDVKVLVQHALNDGINPNEILDGGLLQGMGVIGEKFKNNEIYVPEVLVATRAMNAGSTLLKGRLGESGIEPKGKFVICTVKGDLHDIGKNIVKIMIEGKGLQAIDLGVDVDENTIVEAIKENDAKIVCLSSLLTTTMNEQKVVIEKLKESGLRDKVKVMVGGAPITQSFADKIGADVYTKDATTAAEVAKEFIKKLQTV